MCTLTQMKKGGSVGVRVAEYIIMKELNIERNKIS